VIVAAILGACAGILSGLLGVGGGILFVPALALVLGLPEVRAEATSLLAIIPVALVGAFRQYRYGNVHLRDGVILGILSALGVGGGVALANVLSGRALKLIFAVFMVLVALQFVRRYLQARKAACDDGTAAE
jgi:uncharacterized membrane protein YfcA